MNTIYAISDLHGEYELFKKVQNYIDKTDTVYVLGDSADRGPDGIKILQELIEDKRFHYILGNHDVFLMSYGEDCLNEIYDSISLAGWFENGGYPTYLAFEELTKKDKIKILSFLKKAELKVTLQIDDKTIVLSHAGFDPTPGKEHLEDVLEGRDHYLTPWPEEDEFNNLYIIHGHTPTSLFYKHYFGGYGYIKGGRIDDIVIYHQGHCINIDTAAHWSGKTCLLNLNTFTPIYFRKDEDI